MDRQPVDHYVLLRKYSLRKMKGRVGCGHAAINGRLQENLADFLARHAIVQRSAQVYAKFVSPIQRHHHRQCDHVARLPGKAGAAPDFSPGSA